VDASVELLELFDGRETGWPSILRACHWLSFVLVK